MHQTVIVIDGGSPTVQLLGRYVRESGVYCEIIPCQKVTQELIQQYLNKNLKGIILAGPQHCDSQDYATIAPKYVFEAGVPILAVAGSMPAMAAQVGSNLNVHVRCSRNDNSVTTAQIRARGHTVLLDGIQDHTNSEGHGLLFVALETSFCLSEVPDNFVLMASTDDFPIAGIANEEKGLYGIQFYPELNITSQGAAIINRFVRTICGCVGDWRMSDYINEAIETIRAQVGDDQVILGLSGGVDSSVAATLIHKAIGNQLTCVFVDHGLLRLNESKQVLDMFGSNIGINIIHVDASDRFMTQLSGVTDPEEKRKIIGREFVEVFQEHANSIPGAKWLAQGTIYPDVIESATTGPNKGVAVKSHHNVGGLPDTLHLSLLEPLRDLFKHEVRDLGIALGLPHSMVYRHPFPGPGLGVRILGEIKVQYAEILRHADSIFIEELRNSTNNSTGKSWYDSVSQAFAVFVPVRSVGVTDHGRAYEYVIALRAVETVDYMTAQWANIPYSLLNRVSERIIAEVSGVSRVVYDISGKPPATIEWE